MNMTNIENHLKQLRLQGISNRWNALMETRQHHELSLSEGLEILLQAEQEDFEYLYESLVEGRTPADED